MHARMHARTHTHPFNGPLSGITRVSLYQKGKTNLDFTEARDSQWQWNPLGHMQVCTSLQTDNHTSTPPLRFFTGRTPLLLLNQQCQSTESTKKAIFKATNKTKLNSSHWPQPFSDHQPPSEERGQKLPPHQLFYINTLYNIHYRANLI